MFRNVYRLIFLWEHVDAHTHGVEFLEKKLACVREWDENNVGPVANGTDGVVGWHRTAFPAYGNLEWIGHVKKALQQKS